MYIGGKGRAAGRVRLFVGNRGSGQRFVGSGPKKSDPWTTLISAYLDPPSAVSPPVLSETMTMDPHVKQVSAKSEKPNFVFNNCTVNIFNQ